MKDWYLSTGDWHNDPQLYIRELGHGERTIVVLHGGWGAEHSGMIQVVEGLGAEYRFIFYDQRGSLRSPFPDSLITFDQHIHDIERLRKELLLDQLTIVDHSMRSVLASAYASKYPNHVRQLVLMAPAHLKKPLPEDDVRLQQEANRKYETFMNRPAVEEEFNKYQLYRPSPLLTSKEETAIFRINFAKRMIYHVHKWSNLSGGRTLYKGHVFALTAATYPKDGWDFVQAFREADYKVNIIAGDHDFLDMGNHLIRKWVYDLPKIKLDIIENAGHMLWIDQPASLSRKLQSILK